MVVGGEERKKEREEGEERGGKRGENSPQRETAGYKVREERVANFLATKDAQGCSGAL